MKIKMKSDGIPLKNKLNMHNVIKLYYNWNYQK